MLKMRKLTSITAVLLVSATALIVATGAVAQENNGDVKLIPREKLFGNPEKTTARISPNGDFLAFRAPRDGVMNVWFAPIDRPKKSKISHHLKKSALKS